jgi:hypothetical protein
LLYFHNSEVSRSRSTSEDCLRSTQGRLWRKCISLTTENLRMSSRIPRRTVSWSFPHMTYGTFSLMYDATRSEMTYRCSLRRSRQRTQEWRSSELPRNARGGTLTRSRCRGATLEVGDDYETPRRCACGTANSGTRPRTDCGWTISWRSFGSMRR